MLGGMADVTEILSATDRAAAIRPARVRSSSHLPGVVGRARSGAPRIPPGARLQRYDRAPARVDFRLKGLLLLFVDLDLDLGGGQVLDFVQHAGLLSRA